MTSLEPGDLFEGHRVGFSDHGRPHLARARVWVGLCGEPLSPSKRGGDVYDLCLRCVQLGGLPYLRDEEYPRG